MNKQAAYILQAYLLLAGVAAGYLFISSIPFSSSQQNTVSEAWCGTADPPGRTISQKGLDGKALFQSKCAQCHNVFKDMTGPALGGLQERGPWSDRKQLYKWIRNPGAFMEKDPYTKELKKKFGSVMTAFPNLTDDEIDAIVEYIN